MLLSHCSMAAREGQSCQGHIKPFKNLSNPAGLLRIDLNYARDMPGLVGLTPQRSSIEKIVSTRSTTVDSGSLGGLPSSPGFGSWIGSV
jgi:hypothetical protein